jgi:hypothetical protein
MSTPAPPPEPTAVDPALDPGALFDELDALLNRMLSLPVDASAEGEAPAAGLDLPADVPLITVAEVGLDPVPPPVAPPPPVVFGGDGKEIPPEPAAAGRPAPRPSGPPRLGPVRLDRPPRPPAKAEESAGLPGPSSAGRRLLEAVNRRFDDWAAGLGPPGRLLSGSVGRALLGLAGLGLLALAGALVLRDGFGWTW